MATCRIACSSSLVLAVLPLLLLVLPFCTSEVSVQTVDFHAAKDLVGSDNIYLDVRTTEEFYNGHAKNAVNVICSSPVKGCLSRVRSLQAIEYLINSMVRDYRSYLLELLEAGHIDLCFANEDEARKLLRGELNADPEDALNFSGKHCKWAVVTLGPKGCIAKHGKEVVRVPAIGKEVATDATGAGDLFASGFLYGLVKGLSLEDCCKVGSCSGGSVVKSLGGEVRPENWQWMYQQMKMKGLSVPDFIE